MDAYAQEPYRLVRKSSIRPHALLPTNHITLDKLATASCALIESNSEIGVLSSPAAALLSVSPRLPFVASIPPGFFSRYSESIIAKYTPESDFLAATAAAPPDSSPAANGCKDIVPLASCRCSSMVGKLLVVFAAAIVITLLRARSAQVQPSIRVKFL